MAAADLHALILDARLLLEYAVRAGKLPDDALSDAIHRLEQSDSAVHVIDLQNAMNAVVTAIAPMTLVDLRAGRNPFDARNVRSRSRWQIGLSLATLALIAVIAYYQYLVQREESALLAYRDVLAARGSERITDVRKLVQQGNALAQDSCQRDNYQKARHELRQLASRTVVASTTLYQLSQMSAWPFVETAGSVIERLGGGPAVAAAIASPVALTPPAPPDPRDVATDPCDDSQRPRLVPAGYSDWLRRVVLDSIDEFCFASKLSIDQLAATDPIRGGSASYFGPQGIDHDPVAKVEQRLRVHVGWLLPFLYGLLGACVYVMRRLLFDTKGVVVENVVIVLRLALGALAGVAIGWFAVPAVPAAPSSMPYLIAFFAGFSIDIFFSLLDRFNRLLLDKAQAT